MTSTEIRFPFSGHCFTAAAHAAVAAVHAVRVTSCAICNDTIQDAVRIAPSSSVNRHARPSVYVRPSLSASPSPERGPPARPPTAAVWLQRMAAWLTADASLRAAVRAVLFTSAMI